ncbi:hypothetical protein IscW_ISCW001502 [Ixodes scapularis]|uniref:Uncharacterized protein n=1 Tax=Ixodes scapularis TaxID=6945 RepID=B7P4J2_IXOSC|nr:hypothetical protein IscW_ISCW001502 [Ixodes scapularis]|eukprot:XP_002406092.1 hypothetical protein IscW_ISCW001502 [Ixodes scapularis]
MQSSETHGSLLQRHKVNMLTSFALKFPRRNAATKSETSISLVEQQISYPGKTSWVGYLCKLKEHSSIHARIDIQYYI